MRDVHALVGAYVMDAVSASDRASFERHLATCAECREDVRGLREATARLADAAAIPPRPELRDQTVRAAMTTRQLPPLVTTDGNGRFASAVRFLGRAVSSRGGQAGVPGLMSARRLLAGLATVLVLAVAAAAVVISVHLTTMAHRLSAAQLRTQSIGAILSASDRVTMTANVSRGGTATVVMSHRAHALVFVATGLPRLTSADRYELWLMSPSGPRQAGMLPPARHGMTGPMVVSRLRAGDRLGLTVEPAAGAARPTSAPILLVALGP